MIKIKHIKEEFNDQITLPFNIMGYYYLMPSKIFLVFTQAKL